MNHMIITVAGNMSEATFEEVCAGFRKKFGDDLTFEKKTDESIIGGFIAEFNGEVFDLSIASQLKKMEKHINA